MMKLGLPCQYSLDTAPVSINGVVHASTQIEAVKHRASADGSVSPCTVFTFS